MGDRTSIMNAYMSHNTSHSGDGSHCEGGKWWSESKGDKEGKGYSEGGSGGLSYGSD